MFRKIKLVWVLVTLCVLLLSLFINWQINLKKSHKDLSYEAKTIANNVDGVIEDLLQSVYTLPVYGKELPGCQPVLHKDLDRILVNSSTISGLEINDNQHKLICSTLVNYDPFHSSDNRPRIILGPTKLALFDQPIYLIQQKLGNYYIGVIILSSILEKVLETHNVISNSISLLSKYDKKNLIQVEHNDNEAGWTPLYGKNSKAQLNPGLMSASEKIQSIDGVVVTVYENHKVVLEELWFSQAVLSFLILLTSSLLYLSSKRNQQVLFFAWSYETNLEK